MTVFFPRRHVITRGSRYLYGKDVGSIVVKSYPIAIEIVYRFDIGDRPFCYKVKGYPLDGDSKRGYTYLASVYYLYFYDNDGDGRFETFEQNESERDIHIPEWAGK
jgi:hypothetical protein